MMVIVDYIGVARKALQELHTESARFVQSHGPDPAEESPATRDISEYPRAESVHTVYGQSLALIEIAADQLTAFMKVISPPYETIAPWTCVRSLLEAAALASWLVEPQLSVRDRVERSHAFRYEGLAPVLFRNSVEPQVLQFASRELRYGTLESRGDCAPFVRREAARYGGIGQNCGETRRRNGLDRRSSPDRVPHSQS